MNEVYNGFDCKSTFHQDLIAKEQAKQSRTIHTGVDANEGFNAIRGMFIGCVMVAALAIAVVTVLVLI
jgi:predicted secreted protein